MGLDWDLPPAEYDALKLVEAAVLSASSCERDFCILGKLLPATPQPQSSVFSKDSDESDIIPKLPPLPLLVWLWLPPAMTFDLEEEGAKYCMRFGEEWVMREEGEGPELSDA